MNVAWLMGVSAGDTIIAHDRFNRKYLAQVIRVTKTQIIIQGQYAEQRYRRSDGFLTGNIAYASQFIAPYTAEEAALIQLQTAQATVAAACRKLRCGTLTLEHCARILACLQREGQT